MAHAADKTQIVKFKPGTSSIVITESIKGYDLNVYQLSARAGQTLSVTFKPSNTSCYYNVDGIVGRRFLFNGTTDAGDYSGPLPNDGDYQIKVYQMRSAARRKETCSFSLNLEIRN
jgi:hypothetical protein